MHTVILTILALALPPPAATADDGAGGGCKSRACQQRVRAKALQRHYEHVWASAPAWMRGRLRAIARCESHGNHRVLSPGGRYRGLLQFSFSTWASVGGHGDPAAATRWEQWARGVLLYRTGGPGHWPVCQHR